MNQNQKSIIINNIKTVINNLNSPKNYILSVSEQKAKPKLNSWEIGFLNNIRCNLEHDLIKTLSLKQTVCLEKIFNKIN